MLQDLVLHTKIHTFIIQKIKLVSVTNSNDNNSSSEVKMRKFKFYKQDIYQKIKLNYRKAMKHAVKLSFSTMLFDDLLLNRLPAAAN